MILLVTTINTQQVQHAKPCQCHGDDDDVNDEEDESTGMEEIPEAREVVSEEEMSRPCLRQVVVPTIGAFLLTIYYYYFKVQF